MTDEPLDTLRAHGWRMRAPFCFVRRGECLWLRASGTWWYLNDYGRSYWGDTLQEAVSRMYEDMAPWPSYEEYIPAMEAVR